MDLQVVVSMTFENKDLLLTDWHDPEHLHMSGFMNQNRSTSDSVIKISWGLSWLKPLIWRR